MIADLGDNEMRVTTLTNGRSIAEFMAREMIDLVVSTCACPAIF
jgi:hypothetical protein